MGQRVAFIECRCGHVGCITDPETVARLGDLKQRARIKLRCTMCGSAQQWRISSFSYETGANALAARHRPVGEV